MKDQGLFVVLRKVKIVERIGARCRTTQISRQIGCMNGAEACLLIHRARCFMRALQL